MARRKLLVTGFGPFPTMARNPSGRAALRVAASPRWRVRGVDAKALIITTAYAALGAELNPALLDRPDAVLMIGVAGRARSIRVERRATNRRSTLFPDAEGAKGNGAVGSPVPARTIRIAPVKLLRELRRQGLPSRISHDAGRYLCNASYLRTLAAGMPAAFIHIPRPPRPEKRRLRKAGPSYEGRLGAALVEIAGILLREARGHRAPAVSLRSRTH